MDSNVYTKKQILEVLSKRGYFIDLQTLEAFFQKWKIEAIFENEQGEEFYDKNVAQLVFKKVFDNSQKENHKAVQSKSRILRVVDYDSQEDTQEIKKESKTQTPERIDTQEQEEIKSDDNLIDETEINQEIPKVDLGFDNPKTIHEPVEEQPQNEISPDTLSGMPVLDDEEDKEDYKEQKQEESEEIQPLGDNSSNEVSEPVEENNTQEQDSSGEEDNSDEDFDDMNLLSESFEAQEKFKEYILSEMAKKNMMINTPSFNNEFKLDISEKTISMVARTLAKKIAKHINMIFAKDAKIAEKLAIATENNKKLEKKVMGLEEQNKKLRLLLAESNKNLNSYKPSIFGFYKKINPKN